MRHSSVAPQKRSSRNVQRLNAYVPSALLAVFFLAGFASLAYQVSWVKLLSRTFGVSNYAVTTVLTAFMGGLACGAYLGGRIADRRSDRLRLFGYLEIGLGLYTLLLPVAFDRLPEVYRSLYPLLENSPSLLTLTRFSLSFLLLAPPTTLMGATFPIIVRALVEEREQFGSKLARLYSWNTLGSVLGSIATGYFLIGIWGVKATLWLATALNLLIGLIALALSIALPARERSTPEPTSEPHPTAAVRIGPASPRSYAALGVTFLSGFAALGYEVVWMRILNLLSDHSIYTFSAIVAIVLIGIALGSQWAARNATKGLEPLRTLMLIQIALGISAVLWLPALVKLIQATRGWLGGGIAGNPFMGLGLLVTLIPSLFMGASFPLAAQVYAQETERTGQQVGEVYSINVLGAMLGSLAAGFVLLPVFGAQRSLWLLGLVNLVAAMWAARASQRRGWSISIAGLSAAISLALVLTPQTLYESLFMNVYLPDQVLHIFETVEGTVTIAEYNGIKYIFSNGVHDADTSPLDISTHRLIGYFSGFVRANPRQALVVGLGSGVTSGALTQSVPGQTEIVELSDGMVSAAQLFSDYNNQVLTNPRIKLVIADGRNYLLFTDRHYDVITADTIYPLQAYSSNLYSAEYYQLLASHLSETGVMVQWIDSGLRENEQRILMRTFVQAFPHVLLWQHGGVKLLLGANEPIVPTLAGITSHFTPDVAEQLLPQNIRSPEDILKGFGLKDEALRADLGSGLTISDDHPYNEYFLLLRLGKFDDQR